MDRSVAAVGATSGSISALLLRLLSEGFPANLGAPVLPCPELTLGDLLASPILERLDIGSLLFGILIGLLLGPLLDLCFLARQAWRTWIRTSLAFLAKQHKSENHLYRFA